MHTWQTCSQKPPEMPSASSFVLEYLYCQEVFCLMSHRKPLYCHVNLFLLPILERTWRTISLWFFFILQDYYHVLHQFSSSLFFNWKSCSFPHRSFSKPLLTLLWIVSSDLYLSSCAAPDPALGSSSDSLQGPTAVIVLHASHRQRRLSVVLLPISC